MLIKVKWAAPLLSGTISSRTSETIKLEIPLNSNSFEGFASGDWIQVYRGDQLTSFYKIREASRWMLSLDSLESGLLESGIKGCAS